MICRGSIRWVCGLLTILLQYITYGQTVSGFSTLPEAVLDSPHVVRVSPRVYDSVESWTRLDPVGQTPERSSPENILDSHLRDVDSLRLKLLDIDIAKAELDESATDIWHRLIPDIRLSANIGVQQLAFIDPTTSTPYILPKDSYRLTASLSLSGIIDGAKPERAMLEVQRLQVQKKLTLRAQEARIVRKVQEDQLLHHQLTALNEELTLVQKMLDFKQLLFDQGKIDFDDLTRAQIAVLHLKQTISELGNKRLALRRGLE